MAMPPTVKSRLGLLIWVAVMGAIALLWAFPDLVSRGRQITQPYASMPADCELEEGPCRATFPDGSWVELSVRPPPFRASMPLQWAVRTSDGLPPPVAIELQGVSMNMGLVTLPLEPGPEGATVRGALPVCTTQRMQWRADVVFGGRSAGFELMSVQLGAGHAAAPRPVAPVSSPPTWGPFRLTTASGPLDLADLRGRPTIVYFGYLSCPDVCPTTLATLAQAMDGLEGSDRPHVVFVTVDPERDTPERLAAYTQYFAPDFVGGVVAEPTLPQVTRDWGVVARRAEVPGSALGYTMDHSTQAFLLDAEGNLVAQLAHGSTASAVADAIRELQHR